MLLKIAKNRPKVPLSLAGGSPPEFWGGSLFFFHIEKRYGRDREETKEIEKDREIPRVVHLGFGKYPGTSHI